MLGDEPTPVAGDRPTDRSTYEAAKKEAGRDAKAHVRLALWCEAHGMSAERMKHLAMAVLYDPSNGLARGLMGLVAYQGKWERPDEVSRQVQDDPKRKALMQEYLQRRAKTPDRADDQWKLAIWCEQNGLKDQAIAQYHAGPAAGPDARSGLEAAGVQEGRRPVDQAGMAGGARTGGLSSRTGPTSTGSRCWSSGARALRRDKDAARQRRGGAGR